MKRYDLIVFDWDGTLMDSAGAIVRAIQGASLDLGQSPPSEAEARHVIGLGLEDAMRRAVPNLPADRYPEMAARYRYHYLSSDHELELFDGIQAVIEELRREGKMLAIATGKSRVGLDRALGQSGLGVLFHGSRCADECFSKPHPQMLEELMTEFAVEPGRTLMVGDTSHDLLMARNAGVDGLAVTYGAHTYEYLLEHAPVACLHTVAELAEWLRRHV